MKVLILFALVAVAFGRHVSTSMTLEELAAAIQDPTTNPAIIPYLQLTLNQWNQAIQAGQPVPEVVHIPANVPEIAPPVIGNPTIVAPEIVAPEIVAPEIVAPGAPASPASSLVQIIVNVNGQEQVVSDEAPGIVNVHA